MIVAGVGKIGYRIIQELAGRGESVVAIEQDAAGAAVGTARMIAPVLIGNANAAETLDRAGLREASAVLAVTDNDAVNLSIGLRAKRENPDARIVLRMFDPRLADKMKQSMGLDAVLSTSGISAPSFVACALMPDAVAGVICGAQFVILTFNRAGGVSTPVSSPETQLLLIRRSGTRQFEAADSQTALSPGDEFVAARVWAMSPGLPAHVA